MLREKRAQKERESPSLFGRDFPTTTAAPRGVCRTSGAVVLPRARPNKTTYWLLEERVSSFLLRWGSFFLIIILAFLLLIGIVFFFICGFCHYFCLNSHAVFLLKIHEHLLEFVLGYCSSTKTCNATIFFFSSCRVPPHCDLIGIEAAVQRLYWSSESIAERFLKCLWSMPPPNTPQLVSFIGLTPWSTKSTASPTDPRF